MDSKVVNQYQGVPFFAPARPPYTHSKKDSVGCQFSVVEKDADTCETTPDSTADEKCAAEAVPRSQVDGYWERTLNGCQCVPFPVPETGQSATADRFMDHHVQQTHEQGSPTTSLETIVRAAWALVVSRATKTNDVVFGVTAMAGKDTTCLLPVRLTSDPNLKISEYLSSVQDQTEAVNSFTEKDLKQIHSVYPNGWKAGMFRTVLSVLPLAQQDDAHEVPGSQEWEEKYALVLKVHPVAKGVHIRARFASTAIEPPMMKRLLMQLEAAIYHLHVQDTQRTLRDIELITPEHLSKIWQWNSQVPSTVHRCVHHMFSERVASQPTAPAVCAWNGELSYEQLDDLAARLAESLVALGVGPGKVVPLCFEKSVWTPVAMLGVLKAGAAFAMLEHTLPEERLKTIVRQLGSELVLSTTLNLDLSSRLCDTVLEVGPDLVLRPNPAPEVKLASTGSQAATTDMYAIFTSGSTGIPKIIMFTHSGFTTGLHHQSHLLGFTENSRVFEFSSYSFDCAPHNVFATLTTGGCLCIPSEDDRRNDLVGSMVRMGVTLANLTPMVARLVDPALVPRLKTLLLAGEAVPADLVQRWRDSGSRCCVVNSYGPTECGMASTINWDQSPENDLTRIGKGYGMLTWVVDPEDHQVLMPPGCVGEILLEGPMMNRYINEPERSAKSFVEDPAWLLKGCSNVPGRRGRLYKSGDLAYYHEDGSLSYVCRKDTQVKIRGQRVELGEIESCVKRCVSGSPRVVVEAVNPRGGSSGLTVVAFLQKPDEMPAEEILSGFSARVAPIPIAVKEEMARHLPEHMMPSVFIYVTDIPITNVGKTDRKRLREIGASFIAQSTVSPEQKRQPQTLEERQMQTIWAKILDLDPESIGLDDGFVQLGGHSISAMRVVGEARKLGIQIKVKDMFRFDNLETLMRDRGQAHDSRSAAEAVDEIPLIDPATKARLLEQIDSSGASSRITSQDVEDIYPLTNFQESWNMIKTMTRQFPNYHYADINGPIDPSALEQACRRTVLAFPTLRSCFLTLDNRPWQVVLRDIDVPLRVHDMTEDPSSYFDQFCISDAAEFTLTDPPFQCILFRHRDGSSRVVLRMSHSQYDGFCLPRIFRSVMGVDDESTRPGTAYSSFLAYASRQRTRAMEYWTQLLRGARPTVIKDHLVQASDADIANPKLIQLTKPMPVPRNSSNMTTAIFVSAAWAVIQCRVTGSTDVVLAHITTGRNATLPGIEDVVGCLLNIPLLRVRLSPRTTSTELLRAVQEQFLALEEAETLGFMDIFKHCTDWAPGTTIESTLHQKNVEEHPEIPTSQGKVQVHEFEHHDYSYPFILLAGDVQGDSLKLLLQTGTQVMAKDTASSLVDALIHVINKLANGADEPVLTWMKDIPIESALKR